MADALLSPAVGGAMWVVSAGTIAWCSSQVRKVSDDQTVPLMGVLGAFVFAAQMINFVIPVTGSSGHLGGGLLLAILLGPPAAFLTIASVLFIQALFFADGGLLALGCNIFNLGFFPAFIAYPLLYRRMAGRRPPTMRLLLVTVLAAVVGLQLAAFAVVLETTASAISALPFKAFILLMQPIHLAIGVIEGLATAAVIAFVCRAHPEFLELALTQRPLGKLPLRGMLVGFGLTALLLGGVVSWLASDHPDGLDWAISQVAGSTELPAAEHRIHGALAAVQKQLTLFPDDVWRAEPAVPAAATDPRISRIDNGIASLIGGLITLALCALVGLLLRKPSRRV